MLRFQVKLSSKVCEDRLADRWWTYRRKMVKQYVPNLSMCEHKNHNVCQ